MNLFLAGVTDTFGRNHLIFACICLAIMIVCPILIRKYNIEHQEKYSLKDSSFIMYLDKNHTLGLGMYLTVWKSNGRIPGTFAISYKFSKENQAYSRVIPKENDIKFPDNIHQLLEKLFKLKYVPVEDCFRFLM